MSNTDSEPNEKLAKWVSIAYISYIASIAIPPASIVGLAISIIRKREARGSWLQSHISMQLITSLIALLAGTASFFLAFKSIPMSMGLLATSELYFVWKMAFGLYKLNKRETVKVIS